MLMELPATFDPFRAASGAEVLSGQISAGKFGRLESSVLSIVDDSVSIDLRFGSKPGTKAYLQGTVHVRVELECQRCLGPMAYDLEANIKLAFVRNESEQEGLPEDLEPLLVEGEGVDLTALIEDELILALPLVPMHPELCRQWQDEEAAEEAEPKKENPFAVLAQLKKDN
jgi:uncharacterized protein